MANKKYAYRKPTARREVLVDVVLPTGNVVQMAKPSKYSVIFGMQHIPHNLTERAMEAWKEKGVGNADEVERQFIEQSTPEERAIIMRSSLRIRDEVVRLSRQPKLTLDATNEPDEMCMSDMEEVDIDFLFAWVASGGSAGPELADFRNRPSQGFVDSPFGKELGPEAERASGTAS